MKSEQLKRKPPGFFESFLWTCAGADKDILEVCPGSDRIKYQGIGGIIFATGILAFVSSSYAFWTVFSPKEGMALESTISSEETTMAAIISIAAGLIWGLVIFNIDRFIVSSTGPGDGTSAITWGEFFQALPRILMAGLIGLCLSTPLELRILKPEIDMELHIKQEGIVEELNVQTTLKFAQKEQRLSDEIAAIKSEIQTIKEDTENRRQEISAQRTKLELEAEGKSGTGKAGRGPAWRDKKENLDMQMLEFDEFKKQTQLDVEGKNADILEKKEELMNLRTDKDSEKKYNSQKAHQTDGLLARIEIAHEIGGAMRWVLTLLLLSIELGPIFFKMMISKSTYDYLKEQKKSEALAKRGIFFEHKTYKPDPDSKETPTDTPLEKRVTRDLSIERQQKEAEKQMELELELTSQVHAEYKKKVSADIVNNLDQYIKDSDA